MGEETIESYLARGFQVQDSEIIICPSGACYRIGLLRYPCPLCIQAEEDGVPVAHYHNESLLKEVLEAQVFSRLLTDVARRELEKAGIGFEPNPED